MTVLKGEGTAEIIYGDLSIPAGPKSFGGYLARPDGRVEWPSILVFGPDDEPSGSLKDLCRGFARHGIATLVPHMAGDDDRRLWRAVASGRFLANPAGDWSNGEFGFGVLAYESGIDVAIGLLEQDPLVTGFVSVGAGFDDGAADVLATAGVPVLYIGSRKDDGSSVEDTLAHRDALTNATFVVYPEGESGFWSDDSDGYVQALWEDSFDRIVGFFGRHLPEQI